MNSNTVADDLAFLEQPANAELLDALEGVNHALCNEITALLAKHSIPIPAVAAHLAALVNKLERDDGMARFDDLLRILRTSAKPSVILAVTAGGAAEA